MVSVPAWRPARRCPCAPQGLYFLLETLLAFMTLLEGPLEFIQTVEKLLIQGKPLTYDLVGEEKASTTSEVGDAVVKLLEERVATAR